MKLLSVIIPVYNVEQYLERGVLSVVYQTYRNLEILLIDDGSKDNSGEICDQLARSYNRIRVLHKENGGLSDARNAGLSLAKGEYITFLDSDDYIHPETYSILISQMEENEADITECRTVKVYSTFPPMLKIEAAQIIRMNREEAMLSSYDWKYFTAVVWNKIYKREIVEDKRFPVGRYHEDEFFIHEVLYASSKLVHVAVDLHYYQQRPNSIMASEYNEKHIDAIEAFQNRLDFFKEKNADIYEKGCIKIVDFILNKMQYLSTDRRSRWSQRKSLYYAYGKAFRALDPEVLSIYKSVWKDSKRRIFAIKLLRYSPFLFHYIFALYKKK